MVCDFSNRFMLVLDHLGPKKSDIWELRGEHKKKGNHLFFSRVESGAYRVKVASANEDGEIVRIMQEEFFLVAPINQRIRRVQRSKFKYTRNTKGVTSCVKLGKSGVEPFKYVKKKKVKDGDDDSSDGHHCRSFDLRSESWFFNRLYRAFPDSLLGFHF